MEFGFLNLFHKVLRAIIVILLLQNTYSIGQSYAVKTYTLEDGLPNSNIYSIIQGDDGRIWMGSRNLVSVYNGLNWKHFNPTNDKTGYDITVLRKDAEGKIWALSSRNKVILTFYNGDKWESFKGPVPQSENKIIIRTFNIIGAGAKIQIAVSTNQGLYYYKNSHWTLLNKSNGFPSDLCTNIITYKNKFYIATKNGLVILENGKPDISLNKLIPKEHKEILALDFENKDGKEKLWLLSSYGLGYIQNDKFNVFKEGIRTRDNVTEECVQFITDYFGLVIFGNQRGLKIVNKTNGELLPIDEQSGIRVLFPYCIYLDRELNLWFGGNVGVNKLKSMRFATFRQGTGLLKDDVSAIEERAKNEMVFGHVNGITIKRGDNIKHLVLSQKAENGQSKVLDMCKDNKGNIWFAAVELGIGKLDINNNITWYKSDDGFNSHANSVVVDSNGNVFASSIDNIYKLINGKFQKLELPEQLSKVKFRKLFITPKNEICAASNNSGVVVIEGNKDFRIIKHDTDEKVNSVFAVHFDSKHGILVGTLQGLYKAAANNLEKFEIGIVDNSPVYFIIKDNDGNLWFGTDKGVIKWNGKNSTEYTIRKGLAGLETSRDAGFVDSNNRMWIGTDRGVSKYMKEFDRKPEFPPTVFIETIEPYNKVLNPEDNIEFISETGVLVFRILVMSFTNEEFNTFEYKLEGVDEDWHASEGKYPLLRYANLSPGEYKLLIVAANSNGVKSKVYSIDSIKVPRPFYNSWWFYLTIIIIAGLASITFMNYRIREKYSKSLLTEVDKRTKMLNESEKRYRQMFEKNHAVMLLIDAETLDIVDVNEAAERFYGFDKNTLINFNYSKLSTFGSVEDILGRIEESIQDQKQKISVHRIRNGLETFVEINFSKIVLRERNLLYAIIHDVGARIYAEEALKESEEKYRTLIESMIDGVFVIQSERLLYVNNALAGFIGYNPNEMIGKSFQLFIAPEDLEIVAARYKARISGKEVVNEYETRLLHKDGVTRVHVIMHVSTFKYKAEPATLGTIKNITESRVQELKIKQLSTAIEQNPVGVMITDYDNVIEYVNPKFCEISGYSFDELIGQKPFILSGDNPSKFSDGIRLEVKEGKVWRGEVLNKRKNGSKYWVTATVSPIRNSEGKITHFISVEQDITFEKYAREEIKRNEKLLSSILNHLPVIIAVVDLNGYITFCRGRELEKYGLTNDSLIGVSIFEQFKGNEEIIQVFNRALKGEEFTSISLFDSNIAFEIYYSPLFDSNDEIIGSIAVAANITERYNAQQKIIAAKEEAEKSDRLKTDFLAQMSHEIRTPVNTILSFISLLQDEMKNKISEELSEVFNFIDDGGRRLIRTIDMILNMSQFQTGTYKPIMHPVDLNTDVLKKIVSELTSTAKHKNLALNYFVETQNTIINADSYTVGQIFINLIDNAIKYTHHGKIDIKILEKNKKLIVDVEDTGIGISRDYIPYLFDAFSQEETGYSRRFEGTGLGLALVKKYIEINNAEIQVESMKGEGTKFSVIFKIVG